MKPNIKRMKMMSSSKSGSDVNDFVMAFHDFNK